MTIEEENLCQVEEVKHHWIPLADGTRLAARLWLPDLPRGAPAPAVLEYIPYRKRDMVRARDERNHPVFARHGYACVRVDMRGSGESEGLMTDMYGAEELDDTQLDDRYQTVCDPRLNGRQSVDLAFHVAELVREFT